MNLLINSKENHSELKLFMFWTVGQTQLQYTSIWPDRYLSLFYGILQMIKLLFEKKCIF